MFSFFLMSEERLHFASKCVVTCTGFFQEFGAAALVQFQDAVKQIFDSTPEFRPHVISSRSTPAGAKLSLISSPLPPSRVKPSILRRFLLCSILQRISVLQPGFSSHR